MSKRHEIENRLSEIEGSKFQDVCNAVLEQNYPNISRTGSQRGKQKTIKGTPDAYFRLPNGKYILAEYTTQSNTNKKKFIQKVKDDIDKCLDESKTGVTVKDVEKIIYCCNSRIELKQDKELSEYYSNKGIKLEFKDIDILASALTGRCAHLAKKYLGVSIDTQQILKPEIFADEYATSILATPLTNKFMYREKEVEELVASIQSSSKVTILTGAPGVGKSKLAMEAMERINQRSLTYEVFCITKKKALIHDDLRTYLSADKNYLILVDDANRQSDHLESILCLLRERRKGKIHVLVTVRDYALEDITSLCKEFKTVRIQIERFRNEELTGILRSPDFNIKYFAIQRILEIAKGNPRLAIMATKVVLDKKDLNALNDASSIYDLYFKGAIEEKHIFNDKNLLKTLGLLSFFFSLDLNDTEFIETLVARFGMDLGKFNDALITLETLELAETNTDSSAIKISDQVLATYSFYLAFIKEKEPPLDFRIILRYYFSSHQKQIKDSIIPVTNAFSYNKIYPIHPILVEHWMEIAEDTAKALEFLNIFWFLLSHDTFAFVEAKLSQSVQPAEPKYVFDRNEASRYDQIQDKYLKLLANFFTQPIEDITTAITLSFEYVTYFPDHYTQLLSTIKSAFVFSYEDEYDEHFRQLALWKIIIYNAKNKQTVYIKAFFEIGPDLMKTSFDINLIGREPNTIFLYKFNLRLKTSLKTNNVIAFRKETWDFLQENFEQYEEQSIYFLMRYLERCSNPTKEVYEFDLEFLLRLFDTYFTPSQLTHCYIVRDMVYLFKFCKINHARFASLQKTFTNKAYRYYVLLSRKYLHNQFDDEFDSTYRNRNRTLKLRLRQTFDLKTITEFEDFYSTFIQVYNWKEDESHILEDSLHIVVNQAFINDPQLGFDILKQLINYGNVFGLTPTTVYENMWEHPEQSRLLFRSILEGTFKNRSHWIINFLSSTPAEHISEAYIEDIINLFKTTNDTILFNVFDNLMKVKPDINKTLLEVIVQRMETGQKIFTISIFAFKEIMHHIDDISLVKKVYLQQDQINKHYDYNFNCFLEIVKRDQNFLIEYITTITKTHFIPITSNYAHLKVIWELSNTEILLTKALDYIVELDIPTIGSHFANIFFISLAEDIQERASTFLMDYFKAHLQDLNVVNIVMNITRYSFPKEENNFILEFLLGNSHFESFTMISWQNNSFSGSYSTVFEDIRIKHWEAVLDIFDKIIVKPYRYAKHKNWINDQIRKEKPYAKKEHKQIFMSRLTIK